MARGISPAAQVAVRAGVVRVASFVSMDLSGGPWRTWSGLGDIAIAGIPFTGTGSLVRLSLPTESADLTAHPATLVVAGVPVHLLQEVLSEKLKDRVATVLFGHFTEEGTLIEPPRVFTRFRMNVPVIDEDAGTITVSGESKLRDLRRTQAVLYSAADQKTFFPDAVDEAFEFVPKIADIKPYWGDGDPK